MLTEASKQLIASSPNKTAQEYADLIAAQPPVTVTKILLGDLNSYLRETGLKARLVAVVAGGPFASSVPAETASVIRTDLAEFLDHAADPHVTYLDTTDVGDETRVGYATKTYMAVSVLVQTGDMTVDQVAQVYALGGGRKYLGTAEEIQSFLDSEARADGVLTLRSRSDTLRNSLYNLIDAAEAAGGTLPDFGTLLTEAMGT